MGNPSHTVELADQAHALRQPLTPEPASLGLILTKAKKATTITSLADLPVGLKTPPMEARQEDRLPEGKGWRFEPKWDGFRCLVFRADTEVELRAKSGKSLSRFFPEVVAMTGSLPNQAFILDGELLAFTDGNASFDALQMRLHPADSRIRRLAVETPATFMAFDMLMKPDGPSLLKASLFERRERLEEFYGECGRIHGFDLTPYTHDAVRAQAWLEKAGGPMDGVIAKRLDGIYEPGERSMIKVKKLRTADCVVGGFRYLAGEPLVGSLLLGLYNEQGTLDHVGFTSAFSQLDRMKLTKRLEAMIEPPGFTGKAPGAPSRWSAGKSTAWLPLKPELVVEVQYDQVTAGRFRHGTKFLRWRPDKSPRQCVLAQLDRPHFSYGF